MAFRCIVLFCFLGPLIGIMRMEQGVFGGSVLQVGHPNNATLAFAAGALVFALAMAAARGLLLFKFDALRALPPPIPSKRGLHIAIAALLAMVAYTLFVAGGIHVIMRTVPRGEFRANLGDAGPLSYLCLKVYSPAILAYLVLAYRNRPWREALVQLAIPAILVAMVALSFGFKSGIILAFLPASIVFSWRFSYAWILPLFAAALAAIYVGYAFFENISLGNCGVILDYVWYRLTVLQGDVAWKMWDLHQANFDFPNYGDTLPFILGDRVASVMTGIDRTTPLAWVLTHFGLMVTYLSGYPIEQIMAGHNNTATIFSEGIVAGGLPGILIISALAGVLTYALYSFMDVCLRKNRYIEAAIASSYFVFGLMAWLLGGGITSVVHIAILVGGVTAYFLLKFIEGRRQVAAIDHAT
jgi:hypothetical protein